MTARSGYGGWPLVPSKNFPGETTIACKACGSTDVKLTGCYGYPGTGPGGRGRLGDPGGLDWAECSACKARGYASQKLRFVVKLENLDDREGSVMAEVRGDGALAWALSDQAIGGARWEGVDRDPDYALAFPADWSGLVEQLQKEGYELDLDDYCPPTPNNRGTDASG
jgi:hypothetical protein